LRLDEALSTRCILEFQYFSISRGSYSIYEQISRAGFNPIDWIRFYNLRSFDRINSSATMSQVEKTSGVQYEDARKQFDEKVGGGFVGSRGFDESQNRALYPGQEQYGQPQSTSKQAPNQSYEAYHPSASVSVPSLPYTETRPNFAQAPPPPPQQHPAELSGSTYYAPPPPAPSSQQNEGYGDRPQYQGQNPLAEYQQAAQKVGGPLASGRWDSVAECYMLGGEDIRNVPWEGTPEGEIDAFVSEELYVHSKLLIADDRVVICGSANLNDRSQLGDHDSEIAVVIEDHNLIDSTMNGQPWKATKFAATLRRHIFKKHLGLLPVQDYEKEEANYLPVGVPNEYQFGTEEDRLVADPLDDNFLSFWNSRAHTNTEVFGKVFHPVPHDSVLTWQDYDEWYSKHFREADKKDPNKPAGKYKVGHVVAEEFPGGVQQVKDELSKIRGTLVEMPLLFLKKEDIAQEGLGLNAFTEEVYT
jgi:phospholipase D1/2